MMKTDCWACQLSRADKRQHITEWLYVGIEGVVVVDADDKGHDLRLLYVPQEHVQCGDETELMRATAKKLLSAIGFAIMCNKSFKKCSFDFDNHSFTEHWHAQMNLDY